ncbi:hypothetical protein Dimus_033540, partial [Dionaea muscipula]
IGYLVVEDGKVVIGVGKQVDDGVVCCSLLSGVIDDGGRTPRRWSASARWEEVVVGGAPLLGGE